MSTNIIIPTPIVHAGFLLYECKQGSPEWLAMRAGVITASDFRKARSKVDCLTVQQAAYVNAIRGGMSKSAALSMAGYKAEPKSDLVQRALDGEKVGRPSEAALNLAFQKAVERISKVPLDENYQTWHMKRGHELEPFARMAHEDRLFRLPPDRRGAGAMVEAAGFMTTLDGVFGASADGLIQEHGGSEYKCLASAASLRPVIMDDDISVYMDQIQGCMWISGRSWWHFGLYCPALKPVHLEFQMIEVERDDDYIEALETDLIEFNAVVDDYEARLREKGAEAVAEAAEEVRAMLAAEAAATEPAMEA
jgi:hypothetical protein